MKYPNGIKQQNSNNNHINYDNRGMTLEKDLNDTNQYYIDTGKAYIYKKPTPIKLVNVDYRKSKKQEKSATKTVTKMVFNILFPIFPLMDLFHL